MAIVAQKRAVAAEREGRRTGLVPAARSLSWALPWSLLLALGLLATDAVAQEGDGDSITELSGWAALEVRAFPSAPQNAGQDFDFAVKESECLFDWFALFSPERELQ